MSNRIKRMGKKIGKPCEPETRGIVMVHGAMWYQCNECGKRWRMWLEKGLADRVNTTNHKPVPFTIRCSCGGFASHIDWNNDIHLDAYRPLGSSMSYFRNSPHSDCGIPVLKQDELISQM